MTYKFSKSCDLTSDVGASVVVYDWSTDRVHLCMGGDLHISIGMTLDGAKELAAKIAEAVALLEQAA